MTTVLLIGCGYALFVMFVLAVLAVAKRADADIDRQARAVRARPPEDLALDRMGSRVPIGPAPTTGAPGPSHAQRLGFPPQPGVRWRFAHVPVSGTEEVLGAVTVAGRRAHFTDRDVLLIEQDARDSARHFDRRQRPRS